MFENELRKFDSPMDASEAAGLLRGIIHARDAIMPSAYMPYLIGENSEFSDRSEKEVNYFFSNVYSVLKLFSRAASYHRSIDLRKEAIHFDFASLKSTCNELCLEIKGYKTALKLGNTDPYEFASTGGEGVDALVAYKNLDSLDNDLRNIINFAADNNRLPDESEVQRFKKEIDDIITTLDEAYLLICEASRKLRKNSIKEQKVVADVARVGHERVEIRVGRNDPCPCGSGKKFKHCCFNRQN